ncbi:MAG: hypothetical protein ACKOZM_07865 [Flavobacteriales bacterium]
MKTFLTKTTLFALPILIALLIMEILLRRIPNDYSYKNDYLLQHADSIETLFMGSSHAYYGINPDYFPGNSFNASHISQSIDLDYKIISKFSDHFKSIKQIVVPIDYFTLFSRNSTGIESWRTKNYTIYYNLHTSIKPTDYFEIFAFRPKKNINRLSKYYLQKDNFITCSSKGYGNTEIAQKDLIETGKSASTRHTLKNSNYLQESIEIIDKIIAFSEEKNAFVLFYSSPCYSTYRENLDSIQYNTTLTTIDSICRNHSNTRYVNLMADTSFTASDFRDADHLNPSGAKKMTLKIGEILAGH